MAYLALNSRFKYTLTAYEAAGAGAAKYLPQQRINDTETVFDRDLMRCFFDRVLNEIGRIQMFRQTRQRRRILAHGPGGTRRLPLYVPE